jgi:TrmH family RNA methyltransferase
MPATILSPANPRIKAFRQLVRKGEVDSHKRIPIEGPRLIQEAIETNLPIEVLYVAESRTKDKTIQVLIESLQHSELVVVDDRVFSGMVETESPQGVAALVRLPKLGWDVITARSPLAVVAWQLQDPGNLGALIRSADAFGVDCVLLAKSTVSPFNQKVVRASAGSILRIPCFQWKDPNALVRDLRERDFRFITTSSHYGIDFRQADYKRSVALFIGNEGRGLPYHLIKAADVKVQIPQARIESLNAAVAASIILAEAWRQRSH